MAKAKFRNSGGAPFLVLRGRFVVRARQQPDGDTISFVAEAPFRAGPVSTDIVSSSDNAKAEAVRLQSIDTPEKKQPTGARCRDELLRFLGIDGGAIGLGDADFTANGPTQTSSGWLLTHGMDGNDRALGYVFNANPGFNHGQIISAADVRAVLNRSANFALCKSGWAYPAFYTNTDESHAVLFQDAAAAARGRNLGVWRTDKTATGFIPTPAAVGASGALVYPKFFRRIEKWKSAQPSASKFIAWLKTKPDGRKLVQGAEFDAIPLWELFEKVDARRVCVPYDVTKLWFSE